MKIVAFLVGKIKKVKILKFNKQHTTSPVNLDSFLYIF